MAAEESAGESAGESCTGRDGQDQLLQAKQLPQQFWVSVLQQGSACTSASTPQPPGLLLGAFFGGKTI